MGSIDFIPPVGEHKLGFSRKSIERCIIRMWYACIELSSCDSPINVSSGKELVNTLPKNFYLMSAGVCSEDQILF